VFFCNVALTADEKSALAKHARKQGIEETDVFDRERIRIVLDSPEGLSIRFQYLDLELSSAEQSAFFARWGSDIESLISSSFDTVATRLSRIEFFMERERPPSLNGNSLALRAPWSRVGQAIIMRAYRKDIRAMSAVGLSGRKIASELGVPASSVFNELRRIKQESTKLNA
jgi:hypothetical protein